MIKPVRDQSRRRILLLAYACAPNRGSEAGVGWNRALQAAKYFDTWMICDEKENGDDVRDYLRLNGNFKGLTFEFIEADGLTAFLRRFGPTYYLSYNLWHRRALVAAVRLNQQLKFALAHQVNMCGYREPGYLWKLGVPFIWGPVGGTQNFPWRFLRMASLRGAFREIRRNLLNITQLYLSPRVRSAARTAAVTLAANSTNQRDLARALQIHPILMLETGVTNISDTPRAHEPSRSTIRLLWVGMIQTRKALILLLKALAQLPEDSAYELRVLGEGPYKLHCQHLAELIGVQDKIRWMGFLPQHKVFELYRWADILVFTSLRDTSGNVVLEALAAGLPVICLDHQGVGDIVTDDCGIKIPVTTPREVVGKIAGAILSLADDADEWERLSHGALKRAQDYLWDRKGKEMNSIYEQVLNIKSSSDVRVDRIR